VMYAERGRPVIALAEDLLYKRCSFH